MTKAFGILASVILLVGCGSELNADDLETEIKNLIEEANYCEQDSDCGLLEKEVILGCPFGCFNLVNEDANFSQIIDLGIKFFELKNITCDYKCEPPPSTKAEELKCENNKCIDIRG